MFSPVAAALDLRRDLHWGRLCRTPLDIGVWSLLQPTGRQNHAPQLCWITPELLGCVWMAGGQEGTAGMGIYLSLLAADAEAWSPPVLVSQDPERSEQNPLLFVQGDHLHLIHTAQRSRALDDPTWQAGSTFSMQWTAQLRHQAIPVAALQAGAGAEAWTAATDLIAEPAFCRHPPQPLADGRWLLPIYRSLEAGGAFGHDHAELLPLTADGPHLQAAPVYAVPESTGRVHGSLVPSADGERLLQFFRSRLADRVYRSTAAADGASWSAPEAVALPNNNSSIQALRLASGRLALIYNRFCFEPDPSAPQPWGEANWPRTRWPLSIALSEDDGDSWPWIRDIDTGLGFCGTANWSRNGQLAYPSILEGQPGELHIAYSWGGRAAIRYACLHEGQILGEIEEPVLAGDPDAAADADVDPDADD